MNRKEILLVEDNITLAIGLEASLVSSKYQVHHVTNGEDAVVFCKQRLPGLIVTDVKLEKMDGFTFLQHLRALPGGDEVPVVVISGIVHKQPELEVENMGICHILVKPFSLEKFLTIVNSFFELPRN